MRKAERLFQLITLLRGRRLAVTAKQLSDILEVSERTIYRDIQALMLSGVPIEGEAGIGYMLHREFDLPPLMFTSEELLALLVGSRMVQTWADKSLAHSANTAMEKITAVLPEKFHKAEKECPILIPDYSKNEEEAELSTSIRNAISSQSIINLKYIDANSVLTQRKVEPLGMVFWGGKWTIITHCLLRKAYREFRLDRIKHCEILMESFLTLETKSLEHYLSIVCNTKK